MTLVPKPKKVKVFAASFDSIGLSNEVLKLTWTYPLGVYGTKNFLVGTEVFLETPADVTQVPDEQLIAVLGMSAILGGEVLPGTQEFLDAVTGQDTKNFQTIIGEVRLRPETTTVKNPLPVDDLSVGPAGTVFDVTFQKGTSTTNIKTVRVDAWSISQYGNRVDSVDHMVYAVPGALHKQLGLKKSDLGAAESANRQAVIDWVQGREFWV